MSSFTVAVMLLVTESCSYLTQNTAHRTVHKRVKQWLGLPATASPLSQ